MEKGRGRCSLDSSKKDSEQGLEYHFWTFSEFFFAALDTMVVWVFWQEDLELVRILSL